MSKPAKTKKTSKKAETAPLAPEMPQQQTADFEAINNHLATAGIAVRQAFDNFDFATAKTLLEKEVLPHTPQHPVALNDLAFAEKGLGNFEQAYRLATHSLNFAQTQNLPEIYDNLASICHKLNRFEESKHFGRLAIFTKKEMVKDLPHNELPKRKKKGLHADKTKNIIAFSLSGNDPRQCETAVLNASLASQLYPEWTCRFYVDGSVPEHTFDRLSQHGVQLFRADASPLPPLLRHFAVMADKDVHCFLIRDVDSLLSQKEATAVQSWLDSKQFFHLMRDFYEHTELVLPSMWGGYTGAFDNIENDIVEYFNANGFGRTTVIAFLRTKIYPTLAQSLMIHDDLHLDPDSYAYPRYVLSDIERIPFFHIGFADAFVRTTSINLDKPVAQVEWFLVNRQEQLICYYTTPTQTINGNTVTQLSLPYFYSQNIERGEWQIKYQEIA